MWREHKTGGHLPNKLWAAALDMADRYGIERTVQELGVNPDRFTKKQEQILQSGAQRVSSKKPQFIEMCIQFNGHDTADLVRLRGALWNRANGH